MARDTPVIGIVADDLTGAMDTAGAFASQGLGATVALSPSTHAAGGRPSQVLCYNTQTRDLPESEAAGPVRRATKLLLREGCRRLYKKVDSTFRGHVGPEVAAMLEASGAPYAFVCPAFPDMGRTVRYGVIHVGDAPLSQAQEGRRAVSVLDALRKHADLGVRRVGLNDVERGPPGIERGVGALLAEGLTLIAFDATANEHLASISAVLARRYPDGLAVGSAGLAYALAAELVARGAETGDPRAPEFAAAPFVLVSGSRSPVTRAQLGRLAKVRGFRLISIDPTVVVGSQASEEVESRRIMSEARGALKLGEDVGLCIDGAEEHSDSPGPNTLRKRSRRLGAFLERAVPGLIRESKVSGLVLVGGDTAHSVLAGLQANAVELGGEVQRGIPMGTVAGGDADGKFVVTKGGGFGDRDALVNAVARIARERATGPG